MFGYLNLAAVLLVILGMPLLGRFAPEMQDQAAVLQAEANRSVASATLTKLKNDCDAQCATATTNGCGPEAPASYCVYGSTTAHLEYVDLNGNGKNDLDTTLLNGVGICEDHVYCFHLSPICCGKHLNAATCQDTMSAYWTSMGFSKENIGQLSQLELNPGTCAAQGIKRWDQ